MSLLLLLAAQSAFTVTNALPQRMQVDYVRVWQAR